MLDEIVKKKIERESQIWKVQKLREKESTVRLRKRKSEREKERVKLCY